MDSTDEYVRVKKDNLAVEQSLNCFLMRFMKMILMYGYVVIGTGTGMSRVSSKKLAVAQLCITCTNWNR